VAFTVVATAYEGESKLIVIAAAAGDLSAAASPICLPTSSVWLRKVSGLVATSISSRCCSTSAATARRPIDARLATAATSAPKPWKLQSHLAEQRGSPRSLDGPDFDQV
jgi:hypothetical protein